MKRLLNYILPILAIALVQFSCSKGCEDENALNYDPESNASRKCIYPETFNLTSVGIKAHPAFDSNGNEWDSLDGPDKLIKVFDIERNTPLYVSSVQSFLPVTWKVTPAIPFDSEKVTLRFELYDKDETEEVLMDFALLELEQLVIGTNKEGGNLYPGALTLKGDNNTEFTISMDWTD